MILYLYNNINVITKVTRVSHPKIKSFVGQRRDGGGGVVVCCIHTQYIFFYTITRYHIDKQHINYYMTGNKTAEVYGKVTSSCNLKKNTK